jgi:hypothetical protein
MEGLSLVERHYTVKEISAMWNLSADLIRKMFEQEPGVMAIGKSQSSRARRRYTTLRIPEAVAFRVHRKLCNN